jgi:hypothetical protein
MKYDLLKTVEGVTWEVGEKLRIKGVETEVTSIEDAWEGFNVNCGEHYATYYFPRTAVLFVRTAYGS